MYLFVSLYLSLSLYIYIYVYVYMCVYIYIYIYIFTGRDLREPPRGRGLALRGPRARAGLPGEYIDLGIIIGKLIIYLYYLCIIYIYLYLFN